MPVMGISKKTYNRFKKITGSNRCTNRIEDRLCYSYDAISGNHIPDAVIFPETTEEISEILKLANLETIPVTPRGNGTGTTGGSVPVNGGIVMVMTAFSRIRSIDTENFIAVVEPGVITADLHKAVEEKGLFYPPDPSSSGFSTLGGNIAECAGGPRAVKYGVTRDYVLGLEAVLPTGEPVKTGVRTAKGVVGYDLTRLLTGSEGTLAVITGITLRLLPMPEAVCTMTAVFQTMEAAAKTVSEIMKSRIIPRACEFLDRESIECARSFSDSDLALPDDAGAMLIIEADGSQNEAESAIEALADICHANKASLVRRAKNKSETTELWKARKAVSPALYRFGPDKINEDIVVPRNRIPEMVRRIEALKKETGLTMVSFGHAGDGNIHFNIMLDKKDETQLRKAEKAIDTIFDYTIGMGGTLSGEHGVGITKSKYLHKETGNTEIELMKRIKSSFDPNNILNPGKILFG